MNDSTSESSENQGLVVTNKIFLMGLFGVNWKAAHVTSFPDDPGAKRSGKDVRWAGHYIGNRTLPAGNQYFAVSLFNLSHGRVVRTKDSFIACYVVVVDDVGEKIPIELIERILPPPSYILETSQGCFQYGWILAEPCCDRLMVENLLEGLVAKLALDGKDPGMLGVTRYVRLPEGYNSKASRLIDGEPFKCRLLEFNPWGARFTIEQLAARCGIDLHADRKESKTAGGADVGHPLIDVIEIKGKLASGKYDVTCPWVDEHTGQDDSGTAAWTNADLSIGFKCHHGHCHDRTGKDLVERIEEDSLGWSKRLDTWKLLKGFGVEKRFEEIEEAASAVPPPMKEALDELLADFARLPKTEIAEEHAFKIMQIADKCDRVDQMRAHTRVRDYLGWSIQDFKVILKEQRVKWYSKKKDNDSDKHPNPLSFNGFPHKKISEHSVSLLDTMENFSHLLKEYGITAKLDQIRKKDVISFLNDSSKSLASAFEKIISLVRLNELPQINVVNRLAALAEDNPINPVIEHLSSLDYKGAGFIQRLAEHITVENGTEHIRDRVLRMWMMMACAAADHAESTPNKEAVAKFDSIMIFVGAQGLKKTQFFRAMLPKPLRQYFNDGVMIDPTDRDSISQVIAWWIIEAGEINGMFRKVDLERFKAFLSKHVDVLRRPYGRTDREFERRTVFVGSANEREFLKDHTGNRRYWPLLVEAIIISTDEKLIDNAWVEAWTAYMSGEQWWPDEEFEKILSGQTRSFQVPITDEPVEEAIRAMIEAKMGMFKHDVLRLSDIRNALKVSGLSSHNIEKIPSIHMIGKIMKQHELGIQVRSESCTYWIIRNIKKYKSMKGSAISKYHEDANKVPPPIFKPSF